MCLAWSPGGARAEDTDDTAPVETPEEALFSFDTGIGSIAYRPGRGLQLGKTGLNIGGFVTSEFEKERGEDGIFAVDSINFLVLLQPIQPLRLFMELEIGDLYEVDLRTGEELSEPVANFQRLYGEFSVNDALNLRYGKFQTPVGEWNLVPAEPFTFTTTEPFLLEAFDEQTTGPMIFGSLFPGSGTLSYSLYGQVDAFDPESDEEPVDGSAGGRLRYSASNDAWAIGASFLAQDRDDHWGYLGGADVMLRRGPFEVTSEFAYAWGELENPYTWDVFVQGVAELLPGFFVVGRFEYIVPSGPEPKLSVGDVGAVWAPVPYLHFKATYRFANERHEDVFEGIKASFSVIF